MSSPRFPNPVSVMRPPKPPSWRDFVSNNAGSKMTITTPLAASIDHSALTCRVLEAKSTHVKNIEDVSRISISPIAAMSARPTRQLRRNRAKIHRTRSEHGLLSNELPGNSSIAHRNSEGDVAPTSDQKLVPETSPSETSTEIARRCQSWLASIEACEPLDEVTYYSSTTPEASPVCKDLAAVPPDVVHDEGSLERLYSRRPEHSRSDNFVFSFPDTDSSSVYGEDVDLEIPDEMIVWSAAERRSISPLSRERNNLSHLTVNEKIDRSTNREIDCEMNKKNTSSSSKNEISYVPIFKHFPSEIPDKGRGFPRISSKEHVRQIEDAYQDSSEKSCSRVCCDVCVVFNCYRKKDVHSDVS